MKKSLAVAKSTSSDDEELELLIPHGCGNVSPKRNQVKLRVKIHGVLFTIGLVSSIGCLWTMLYTSDSKQVAKNLGLNRVANSLENILSLLAYPFLMFMVILTLYAGQQLYRLYKEANDPQSFQGHRSG